MNHQDIRDALARIHRELDRSEALDAETRAMLVELNEELEERLSRHEKADEDDGSFDDLAERFDEARGRFAVEHPRLRSVLEPLISMLSRMGI